MSEQKSFKQNNPGEPITFIVGNEHLLYCIRKNETNSNKKNVHYLKENVWIPFKDNFDTKYLTFNEDKLLCIDEENNVYFKKVSKTDPDGDEWLPLPNKYKSGCILGNKIYLVDEQKKVFKFNNTQDFSTPEPINIDKQVNRIRSSNNSLYINADFPYKVEKLDFNNLTKVYNDSVEDLFIYKDKIYVTKNGFILLVNDVSNSSQIGTPTYKRKDGVDIPVYLNYVTVVRDRIFGYTPFLAMEYIDNKWVFAYKVSKLEGILLFIQSLIWQYVGDYKLKEFFLAIIGGFVAIVILLMII